jgi:hypothetical protein
MNSFEMSTVVLGLSSTMPRVLRLPVRAGSFAQSEHKYGHDGCSGNGGSVDATAVHFDPLAFIPMHWFMTASRF